MFSGSYVNCITCWSRAKQGNIWKVLLCCHLANFYFLYVNYSACARFAALQINGVEVNRSVCRHAQTARRCHTRRVHSSIHTAAPSRRVPFASTENTSRCGPSVPDEPDAVDAVCTRVTRRVPFRTVRASGKNASVNTALEYMLHGARCCKNHESKWQQPEPKLLNVGHPGM